MVPVPVEECLQKIRNYCKKNLADILYEIGEAIPPVDEFDAAGPGTYWCLPLL